MSKHAQHLKTFSAKKIRIAKEGATTDGREIPREWLTQMAANYDPKTYGARINLEHYRGVSPDGLFKCYGDVTALSTEEEDGAVYLVADIEPTADLVEMNKAKQKVYTSMEVDPKFSDTGEAYLVGLAVTDSPASLGTSYMQFTASKKEEEHPLSDRKLRPENLFSAAMETAFEIKEVEDKKSLLSSVKSIVGKHFKAAEENTGQLRGEVTQAFEEFAATISETMPSKADLSSVDKRLTEVTDSFNKLQEDYAALVEKLSKQVATKPRTFATGATSEEQTDC